MYSNLDSQGSVALQQRQHVGFMVKFVPNVLDSTGCMHYLPFLSRLLSNFSQVKVLKRAKLVSHRVTVSHLLY